MEVIGSVLWLCLYNPKGKVELVRVNVCAFVHACVHTCVCMYSVTMHLSVYTVLNTHSMYVHRASSYWPTLSYSNTG